MNCDRFLWTSFVYSQSYWAFGISGPKRISRSKRCAGKPLFYVLLSWERMRETLKNKSSPSRSRITKPCLKPDHFKSESVGSTDKGLPLQSVLWTSSHSADPCAQNSPTEACSSPSVCSCAIDSWPLKHTEEKSHIHTLYTHTVAAAWAAVFISSHGSHFQLNCLRTQCQAFGTAKAPLLCLTEHIQWKLKRLFTLTH